MRIAIQAADLDSSRIDGTRVYISQCLKYFGKLDPASDFLIYHKSEFNPELAPPNFPNYKIIKKPLRHLWTQTLFALNLWKNKPDVLWMPMHNMPLVRKRGIKTIMTIHDLAFKYFPETFTKKDLFKINLLTKIAINSADRIITISKSSKRDILKFYPSVKSENIKVIYHGFDAEIYDRERDSEKEEEIKKKYNISGDYILYIGAIQPRKNLEKLVEAFEKVKNNCHSGLPARPAGGDPESSLKTSDNSLDSRFRGNDKLKLVLVGEKAWLSDELFKKIGKSPHQKDIICPGQIGFEESGHLLRGAKAFVFPTLYEGFGIPILEAFASRVPVICAENSSLPEVAGEAALYFKNNDVSDLADKIKKILEDENLRLELVAKGLEQIKKFSWEKCARETLEYLKEE